MLLVYNWPQPGAFQLGSHVYLCWAWFSSAVLLANRKIKHKQCFRTMVVAPKQRELWSCWEGAAKDLEKLDAFPEEGPREGPPEEGWRSPKARAWWCPRKGQNQQDNGTRGKQKRPQTPHQPPTITPYGLVHEEPKELGLDWKKKGWWGHGEPGATAEIFCCVKDRGSRSGCRCHCSGEVLD